MLLSVPPRPSCPGMAQTSGCTTVMAVAELFVATGSVVVDVSLTTFVSVEAVAGEVTLIVTVAVVPFVIVPSAQVTVTVPLQVPCEGVAEINVVPAGRGSVSTTAAASTSPRSSSCTVYVSVEKTNTGVGAALMDTAMSACAAVSTNTVVVVALFAALVSGAEEVTFAELVMVVPAAVPAFTFTT